ncbi:sensor histidine kinase [Kutzneria sp. CA-103260]|uniref:sensor histidine kinase n=1 Tax=Kutzneria sp. CA-103260 TaxID=2802641 RepID=UPI00201166ED|nr:sensor histidine kinase [Kutzneria sp. CA-103260]
MLRSLWYEPRPTQRPPRTWRDWALVGVFVSGAVLEGVLQQNLAWRPVAVTVAIALAPLLLWRRSRPLPAIAIAFVVAGLAPLLTHGQPPDIYAMVYMLLLPYSLLRWGSGRDMVLGSAVVLAKIGFWLLAGFVDAGQALGEGAVLVTAGAVGAAVRYRARARRRELDQAKLLERERLARDLHDTVAHHVSAMAIRAQAGLAIAETQPEAASEALRLIEAEASRALTEMRAMVRVLRLDEPAELAPNPRITDLEGLAGRESAGPMVEVEILGDVQGVSPSVGAAIYRLAQESVTNARRHARHATRIDVRVAADDRSVRLQVSDDGDGGRAAGSSGYGLAGMAERAGLLGGTCAAGPNPDRGWTVTAVLPRTGTRA